MALLARANPLAVRPTAAPARLVALRPTGRVAVRPLTRPVAAAKDDTTFDSEEVNAKLKEVGTFLQDKWEKTEDKPAAVAVTLGALLALVAVSSVVDAVDKIPIVSDLIELVGVGVTGWFTYRYLVFGPDREELISKIKAFLKKVYGA